MNEIIDHNKILAKQDPTIEEVLEAKIVYLLGVFPKMTPSMLQIMIGSSLSPKIWKPLLNRLIESGRLQMDVSIKEPPFSDRSQTFHIISLKKTV